MNTTLGVWYLQRNKSQTRFSSQAHLKCQPSLSPSWAPALSPGEVHVVRQVVVQVRKRNLVLRADRLPDDDLVNVIEFIPVFIPKAQNQG